MLRMTLSSAAVTMLVAAAPLSAQAQTMNCKEEMAKAEPMMNSMTDTTKRQSAVAEINTAKEMMTKNDEQGCMTHVQNAMGMLK